MKNIYLRTVYALLVCFLVQSSYAASLSLFSLMDSTSSISEDALTGIDFQIGAGDGTVANGKSGDRDNVPAFGDDINIFPREQNFQVGTLTFDASGISGIGNETVLITSLDLGAFWSADPNRTSSSASDDATVLSDISDFAIGLWLFNGPGGIGFGALDTSDSVTFTNGVLTSVDVNLTTTFSVEAFGTPVVWSGVFSIAGDDISYQINDTQTTGFGSSTLVFDLEGTVNSVGTYAIPEPSSLILMMVAFVGMIGVIRKRK